MLTILRRRARDHVARRKLRELKDAGQVHLQHLLPVRERDILGRTAADRAALLMRMSTRPSLSFTAEKSDSAPPTLERSA